MGAQTAAAMAEATDLDTGLAWHLQSNHYPPVSLEFLDVARQAVAAGLEALLAEDFAPLQEIVVMPNRVKKTLLAIVDELHLDPFVYALYHAALKSEV